MSARQSFGIYLETAGPGNAAARMRREVGSVAARALYERWSGRIIDLRTTPEDVIAALGPPDDEDELTLSYALPTRVGYLYSFSFADDSHPRRLRSSGFRRVDGRGTANVDATARRELPRKLAEAGATADEVRSWLGSPAREYGWWPVEAWEYPDGLILQLRHAVVEA